MFNRQLHALKRPLCFIMLFSWSVIVLNVKAQEIQVMNLKVDHLQYPALQVVNGYPIGGHDTSIGQRVEIANKQPVFGWELTGAPETMQSAYRILVATHRDSLAKGVGNVWDSGEVMSMESTNVMYQGVPLQGNAAYVWQVMVWDREGKQSQWSTLSSFWTADTLRDYRTSTYPLQKTDESPKSLAVIDGVMRVDFGKASFGQLRMLLTSLAGGDTVTVRLGEAINPDGRINRNPGGTVRYAEYCMPLMQGRHSYQLQFAPDQRNTGLQAIRMPDDIGEVFPFRYVEVDGYTHAADIGDFTRATVHYPFDDFAAHFESSDSILNAVWELCKYSIKATSFAGIYVDGDRERIPYEADAYINQLCHYGVDKEYSMARRSHEYLLHHATWPTEWILQSVLMAYNDYRYTGDIRSARHHYEDLKAKLLLPLRDTNGLISTRRGQQTKALMQSIHYGGEELRDIVDWPHTGGFGMVGNGETDGFVFTDYNAVVNAFHYKALIDMAKLAAALGKTEDATVFTQHANETYQAFQSLLWDTARHVYRDGIDTDHASLHTNMMAMAVGLVPEKEIANVMDFIRSRGMACSVYGSQFLLDAIYDAGDADYGLSLLTSQGDRSWYNMIRAGSTITMEAWDNKYKPNQDWNHAWGAVPANIIPRKLMGVEPLEPGWNTFRVRPQIGSLEWATIKVPTIKGTIDISCKQDAFAYTLHFAVPVNTVAQVEVPLSARKEMQISLNGRPLKANVNGDWLILPPMTSGSHELIVNYDKH